MSMSMAMDTLRGRFMRLKQGHGAYEVFAPTVGVSHQTLKAFARGQHVNSRTLAKIEAWCDRQEQAKDIPCPN